MERQNENWQDGNRREYERNENEENRQEGRRQRRRQIHMLHDIGQQQSQHPVPQDVQPFLGMMQLQDSNNNTNHKSSSSNNTNYNNINHSPTHSSTIYKTLHPSQLSVNTPPTTTKTIYDKILIYGIVWYKDISGLFDYQEKDKNQKSTIVIEEDVRSFINFVNVRGENNMLPNKEDVVMVVFKDRMKKVLCEKVLLEEVDITALKRHLPNSKETNDKGEKYSTDKEFLCVFKIIVNNLTNQFTIRVYSFDQLIKQVSLVRNNRADNSEKRQNQADQKLNIRQIEENSQAQSQQPQKQQPIQPIINCKQQPQPKSLIPVHPPTEPHPSHQPYFIIRTLSKNSAQQSIGYKLYPGDLIKLGKIQFKVISIDGFSIQNRSNQYHQGALQLAQIAEQQQQQIQCKYCLGGRAQDINNFFVHLCNCRGHIGYVHYNCLTTWTTTRSSSQSSQNVKMYYLQQMRCEVCTKQFPKYFRYNNKLYHILPIDLPQKHLMLVDVSQKQDATTAVITFQKNENKSIIIGRGRNAQLRVTDITVSRQHASITRIGDDYYIKDMKSKFGTLVRSMEKEIETDIQHKKGFQISNVIFTVQVIKRQVQIDKEADKQSEKVINSEKIFEEQLKSAQNNETINSKNNNFSQNNNNSLSTIFNRNSEQDNYPNSSSLDLQKLNPHISTDNTRQKLTLDIIKPTEQIKEQIKMIEIEQNGDFIDKEPVILELDDQKVIEEEEQTRTSKRQKNKVTRKEYFDNKMIEERTNRQQSIKKLLQKRLSQREKMNSLQQESDGIELENDQNTRNVANNAELIPSSSSSSQSLKRTQTKKISFEENQEKESSSN